MKKYWKIIIIALLTILLLFYVQYSFKDYNELTYIEEEYKEYLFADTISENINLGKYYGFIDSLVVKYDSLTPYKLDEYLLVHYNDWIIDSLEETDYYRKIEKGEFVYDFMALDIIHKNDTIFIPREGYAETFREKQKNILIDVNIPEFKLRIKEKDSTLFTFPIRVGRDEKKFLAMAGNEVNLKTRTGTGKIVRINKEARFVNPANNKEYFTTKRDDNKRTLLPNVPWIEPEINGTRYGQLIHPTTNPKSLGKAYSNGCMGMKEADAWRFFYYAPIGTKVNIRYDLEVINEEGDTIQLPDIYNWKDRMPDHKLVASLVMPTSTNHACYCVYE